jgi:hypothetical protein
MMSCLHHPLVWVSPYRLGRGTLSPTFSAVKRLSRNSGLMKLLGCCLQVGKHILIYRVFLVNNIFFMIIFNFKNKINISNLIIMNIKY